MLRMSGVCRRVAEPAGWSGPRRTDGIAAGDLSGGEQVGSAGQVAGGRGEPGLEVGMARPRQRNREKPHDRFAVPEIFSARSRTAPREETSPCCGSQRTRRRTEGASYQPLHQQRGTAAARASMISWCGSSLCARRDTGEYRVPPAAKSRNRGRSEATGNPSCDRRQPAPNAPGIPRDPSIVRRAAAVGRALEPTSIATECHAVEVNRVARRVDEGGHDVPNEETVRRWKGAQANLQATCGAVSTIRMLDHSGTEAVTAANRRDGLRRINAEARRWLREQTRGVTASRRADGIARRQVRPHRTEPIDRSHNWALAAIAGMKSAVVDGVP